MEATSCVLLNTLIETLGNKLSTSIVDARALNNTGQRFSRTTPAEANARVDLQSIR